MKKRSILPVLCLLAALSGCASTVQEAPAPQETPAAQDTPVVQQVEPERNLTPAKKAPQIVLEQEELPDASLHPVEPPVEIQSAPAEAAAEISCGGAALTIPRPAGWVTAAVSADSGLSDGLRFSPKTSEAGFVIGFHDDLFGVCGTGLVQETMSLADGTEVYVGYYDGSPDWSFVSFRAVNEYLAAINEGLTGDAAAEALELILQASYTA